MELLKTQTLTNQLLPLPKELAIQKTTMESSQGITFESINDTPLEFASDEIQALKCLSYAELKLRCRLKGCTFQNSRIDCFKPKENTIIEKLESYFNIKVSIWNLYVYELNNIGWFNKINLTTWQAQCS